MFYKLFLTEFSLQMKGTFKASRLLCTVFLKCQEHLSVMRETKDSMLISPQRRAFESGDLKPIYLNGNLIFFKEASQWIQYFIAQCGTNTTTSGHLYQQKFWWTWHADAQLDIFRRPMKISKPIKINDQDVKCEMRLPYFTPKAKFKLFLGSAQYWSLAEMHEVALLE